MSPETEIRESLPGDRAAIESLYPAAFPDEDLLPLLRALLQEPAGVLSLVATVDAAIAGHVLFTNCGIAGTTEALALLGPLAVATARQRQGVGSALVRTGLQRLEDAGVAQVCVLGDPGYYGRFGFAPEEAVAPPCPLPGEWRAAWQSITLSHAEPSRPGTLTVPPPWQQPALWGP